VLDLFRNATPVTRELVTGQRPSAAAGTD
jgi:hypothetical protein